VNDTDSPSPVATARAAGQARAAGGSWHSRLKVSFPLMVMAAITAAISYQHAYDVVGHVGGNSRMVAVLLPVVPDLAVFMSYRRLRDADRDTMQTVLATVIMWCGIAVTVVLNAAAGRGHGWPAGSLNALAPLALVGSLHLMTRRRGKDAGEDAEGRAEPGAHCPHGSVSTVQDMARLIYEHARDHTEAPVTQREIAAAMKAGRNHLFAVSPVAPEPSMNGSGPHA